MGQIMYMRKSEVHTAPINLPIIGTALNDFTWEQIRQISNAGLAANYFSVGDTKSIIIDGKVGATTFSSLTIDVFILGIDHNASIEGSNKIHFSIGKINGMDVCLCDSKYNSQVDNYTTGYFTMNDLNSSYGGWTSSHMRKTILGSNSTPASPTANTLLAALPSDLLAVMKSVTKYSDNTGDGSDTASNVTKTTDYLWLLAEFEVFGTRKSANSTEQNYQAQYDYYKAGNSKERKRHDALGNAGCWWLRSAYTDTTMNTNTAFCYTSSSGGNSRSAAKLSSGVAPAFAV